MAASGIDFLAFSAHKVYAPFGCGVLAARKGLLGFGADVREQIRLSGEENVGGIAALGKALQRPAPARRGRPRGIGARLRALEELKKYADGTDPRGG